VSLLQMVIRSVDLAARPQNQRVPKSLEQGELGIEGAGFVG